MGEISSKPRKRRRIDAWRARRGFCAAPCANTRSLAATSSSSRSLPKLGGARHAPRAAALQRLRKSGKAARRCQAQPIEVEALARLSVARAARPPDSSAGCERRARALLPGALVREATERRQQRRPFERRAGLRVELGGAHASAVFGCRGVCHAAGIASISRRSGRGPRHRRAGAGRRFRAAARPGWRARSARGWSPAR